MNFTISVQICNSRLFLRDTFAKMNSLPFSPHLTFLCELSSDGGLCALPATFQKKGF